MTLLNRHIFTKMCTDVWPSFLHHYIRELCVNFSFYWLCSQAHFIIDILSLKPYTVCNDYASLSVGVYHCICDSSSVC